MTKARDLVWHAGRLVQWGLRPLARPAQEAEYRELVERYFDGCGSIGTEGNEVVAIT